MKIDIIYRGCSWESDGEIRLSRPAWFDKRKCYKSVWDMTNNDPSTFSVHVFYDGVGSSLLDYIKGMRVADSAIYEITRPAGIDKYYSIYKAYELADTLTGDWIYFVEDDYLHAPDAARVMLEGANRFELLSLYDHLDRYTRSDDITVGKESVALSNSCHWRTAESTCHTWACSRKMWERIKNIAKLHGPNDRSFFYDLIAEGIRLWTPIPARSTHCVKGYMSPMVNWDAVAAGVNL